MIQKICSEKKEKGKMKKLNENEAKQAAGGNVRTACSE